MCRLAREGEIQPAGLPARRRHRDGATVKERSLARFGSLPRAFGWCSKEDVLIAFRAVSQEIRAKQRRLDPETLTLAEACQLAARIKDQRDLVHQMSARRSWEHVRRLIRLNGKHREKLLEIARQAGLDTSVLIFK